MSPRSVLMGLVVSLILGACTAGGSSPTVAGTTPAGPLLGRLVVLDDTGNVRTMDPDGTKQVELTSDAGGAVRYFQPIWSPAGQTVAWSEDTPTGASVRVAGSDGSSPSTFSVSSFPFYLSWGPDSDRIGVLHNSTVAGLDFEVVDLEADAVNRLGRGGPYYFSWSPNDSRVISHVSGDQLLLVSQDGATSPLARTAPNYQAPSWTEKGILHLSAEGLALQTPGGDAKVLATADGLVSFVADPQGRRVAVQVLSRQPSDLTVSLAAMPAAPTNQIFTVDLDSGELQTVSSRASVGFFWSPDGGKLLMLLPTDSQGTVDVAVWVSGEATVLASLKLPGSLIQEALQFFDQYAQSWQMWSPDSSSFVLPGTREDESGIWRFSLDGTDPVPVTPGSWAAWSAD